jgi:hypothetical protein
MPTLLDPVEEALNQVAGPVQVWAKADRVLRFRFGKMLVHAPCSSENTLIQSSSYPRSASNIAPDVKSAG